MATDPRSTFPASADIHAIATSSLRDFQMGGHRPFWNEKPHETGEWLLRLAYSTIEFIGCAGEDADALNMDRAGMIEVRSEVTVMGSQHRRNVFEGVNVLLALAAFHLEKG